MRSVSVASIVTCPGCQKRLKIGTDKPGGKPDKALPQLRFYVLNAETSADEDAMAKILESRFVIAQMLGAAGHADEALTELEAVRPLLAEAFGANSAQVRNVDKQIARLRSGREHGLLQGRDQSDA